jgi:acetyltransferase-like isoleucine patch superfamily enzyme
VFVLKLLNKINIGVKLRSKPFVIKDGVWMGEDGVVTSDVPIYCVVCGNSARLIKVLGDFGNSAMI